MIMVKKVWQVMVMILSWYMFYRVMEEEDENWQYKQFFLTYIFLAAFTFYNT